MDIPDFREPLSYEINLAREVIEAVSRMLPQQTGRGKREDLCAVLSAIVVEHAGCAMHLFELQMYSSAYALMRTIFEAAYRSIWIAKVADDRAVERAYQGRDIFPELKVLVRELQSHVQPTDLALTLGRIRPHLRKLHERTHTGADQTLRRLRSDDPRQAEYSFGQVLSDVRTVASASLLVLYTFGTPEQIGAIAQLLAANYSYLRAPTSLGL